MNQNDLPRPRSAARRPQRRAATLLSLLTILCVCTARASAKTLVLTDVDCERMACISASAPRLSWAGSDAGEGFFSNYFIELIPQRSFLIRYPLDRIPPGQRIVNAEWTLPVSLVYPALNPRLNIQRILAPWGPGACHEFRQVLPTKEPWKLPGAMAPGLDRAAKPSVSVRLNNPGNTTVNVTQDVELWYSQRARNEGWIVSTDEPNCMVRFASPCVTGPATWILRVTYEPE